MTLQPTIDHFENLAVILVLHTYFLLTVKTFRKLRDTAKEAETLRAAKWEGSFPNKFWIYKKERPAIPKIQAPELGFFLCALTTISGY